MPIEKEAARRAERPYTGCEELSNKLDLDDELYRVLCRLDRARFLQGLSSPRGSPWNVTWTTLSSTVELLYHRSEEQMVREELTRSNRLLRLVSVDLEETLTLGGSETLDSLYVVDVNPGALSGFREADVVPLS
jgi:hypothetical protein